MQENWLRLRKKEQKLNKIITVDLVTSNNASGVIFLTSGRDFIITLILLKDKLEFVLSLDFDSMAESFFEVFTELFILTFNYLIIYLLAQFVCELIKPARNYFDVLIFFNLTFFCLLMKLVAILTFQSKLKITLLPICTNFQKLFLKVV